MMDVASRHILDPDIIHSACRDVCEAKCCKAPGHFVATTAEMRHLKVLAAKRGKKIKFLSSRTVGPHGVWGVDFDFNGGQCPFLENNECSIHDERPDACRRFPVEPTMGCVIWPGNNPSVRVEMGRKPQPVSEMTKQALLKAIVDRPLSDLGTILHG